MVLFFSFMTNLSVEFDFLEIGDGGHRCPRLLRSIQKILIHVLALGEWHAG